MKSIKKAKKIANFKRGCIRWGSFILSFVPIISVFVFLDLLLTSYNGFTYVKILALLGVLVIFKYMWKFTKFLLNRTEEWYIKKYEAGDGDDDVIQDY